MVVESHRSWRKGILDGGHQESFLRGSGAQMDGSVQRASEPAARRHGERLLSQEEVVRLQGLRGRYGITSPAPICEDPIAGSAAESADCQVVFAPSSAPGERLVPGRAVPTGADDEIRLTYRELTALIEDAVKHLK